jgi:hypothetical protein
MDVAVKVLNQAMMEMDGSTKEEFEREANFLMHIRHRVGQAGH